jgi:cytoskeletal protein CcmA (bactofilin family)
VQPHSAPAGLFVISSLSGAIVDNEVSDLEATSDGRPKNSKSEIRSSKQLPNDGENSKRGAPVLVIPSLANSSLFRISGFEFPPAIGWATSRKFHNFATMPRDRIPAALRKVRANKKLTFRHPSLILDGCSFYTKETRVMQMFSSSRKVEPVTPTAPAPPPAPPKSEPTSNGSAEGSRAGGVLSSGVSIKGSVKFQKELHIDGTVEGTIDSNGRLTIGEHATIKGEIKTKTVVVDGTVEGNILAGERCELRAGCTVNGDIESPRLIVDEAATFIGSAKIATKKPGSA